MSTVGLRELRQDASELIRRVEAGEEITITVSGRPSARLVPIKPQTWRSSSHIAGLLSGPMDTHWPDDLEGIDRDVRDPWNEILDH
jgi:prevent-host-death family protein